MGFAAYCRNGHLIGVVHSPRTGGELRRLAERHAAGVPFFAPFCTECGEATVSGCPKCQARIDLNAKYCGGCGKALPWTEVALEAARAYTDDLDDFTPDEKAKLNQNFKALTTDSPETPLAARLLQKAVEKAGPVVGSAILEIAKTLATAEGKKYFGL
jgi:hypothetical protein